MLKKFFSPGELIKKLAERRSETDKTVNSAVSDILEDVRKNGDAAVRKYAEKFDGFNSKNLK
ncbi:MAG: histidinol dehydrogenase, partial [Clostridiales bacterium]|nr:histidinol dehydrogenase [Clostridiales bacterium]